jgi:putative permease
VFALFIGLLTMILLILLPLVWRQLSSLVSELPRMLGEWQALLLQLPERYPQLIGQQQILQLTETLQGEMGHLGQWALNVSLSSLPLMATFVIYLVLVPILVFFFLKDGRQIGAWMAAFLPSERPLMTHIWHEMHLQIANYIRGKVIEIFIVGVVSYVAFMWLGLNYAALLALLVGLSVLVPYIGAAVVTFPVLLIGLFQWGLGDQLFILVVVYFTIQALDGNVLVPILFSEVVSLHPVAIIGAVLLFGGLWGFWGVFFSIPLATLCKALLDAWPRIGVAEPSSA